MAPPRPPRPSSQANQPFVPKPFPPPALRGVPEEYIVSQLHRLAPNYWNRPETADCTIIVPCDVARRKTAQPPDPDPLTTGPFSDQNRARSTRDSEPKSNTRRMVLKLHQDYLSAQSTFMRGLLSGTSPLDLSTSSSSSAASALPSISESTPRQPTSPLAAGAFPIHPSRHPRVLPSSSSHHPVVFLPVPDAISLPHLIHYLYFGSFDYMEECLHRGIITWQGIVRNVEFFGMRLELKASLGRYYRQWLKPTARQEISTPDLPMEDSEGEEDSSGSQSEASSGSAASAGRKKPHS
ncbi:hypothetical protein JB92DRAFT_1959955 [Gautieria morchelliformis]|nr:hypothetical protein JB92DRAFT_1959955 [Gautieria morchelliformis]